MLKRISIFLYGIVSYAVFFATFLYAIGFVGNFIVPVTMDGVPRTPTGSALLIDLALLGSFALLYALVLGLWGVYRLQDTTLGKVGAMAAAVVLLGCCCCCGGLLLMTSVMAAMQRSG